jgi:hypothetical protein
VPSLRKALELPIAEWFLVFRAGFWFAIVEVGLRILRFTTLIKILGDRKLPERVRGSQSCSAERVAYCVDLASRFDPLQATCLKKALVLYALLIRRGLDVRLFIGAAKTKADLANRIDYHAWLEHQGRVILGGDKSELYIPLYCVYGSNAEGCAHGQPIT